MVGKSLRAAAASAPKAHGDELYLSSADLVWALIRSLFWPVGARVLASRKGFMLLGMVLCALSDKFSFISGSCAPAPCMLHCQSEFKKTAECPGAGNQSK